MNRSSALAAESIAAQVEHPHDLVSLALPERLAPEIVRRLSALDTGIALRAIASEWAGIALAIGIASRFDSPLAALIALPWIAARQHALAILAHDASHYRLLPNRRWNDWIGNLFLAWPVFISVEGFRHFHGEHHRHLGDAQDGNRPLWRTHDANGTLSAEWSYPKTRLGLARVLVRRAAFVTGLRWMLRGLIGGFLFGVSPGAALVRLALFAAAAACFTWTHSWRGFLAFWVLPYCTWHIAIQHHFYPSVPWYRLPELHRQLCAETAFGTEAVVRRSIRASLRECVRAEGAADVARS